MEVINLKAIPIAWDQNVYRFSKKEMDQLNKIKYTNHYKSKGVFVSKNLSLLELRPFSSIKKFIIKKAEEYMKNVLEINNDIYIHFGPYGYYMKYKNKNYKINQTGIYSEKYCLSLIK